MQAFQTLGFSDSILRGINDAGYDMPTPIQAQAVPLALAGRDLIGCAQTGTGKTAAFVLPMLDRLAAQPTNKGPRAPRALVVTPTRELALQVETAVRAYGKHARLYSLTIFGGVSMGPQIKGLRRGVDIVVATPGRLLDHLNRGNLDLSAIQTLVLDEADQMLDMGFIHDMRKIVKATPRDRQTLLFSATMPKELQDLAGEVLTNPELVMIGEQKSAAETVQQHACLVAKERKMDLLLHVLRTEPVEQVLVFTRTKHRADRVAKKLSKQGIGAEAIHSNRSQNQRQRTLRNFRNRKVQVLVATNVAARGIDVDGISHVINFNTPSQPETYIHRIGRTGRAEAEGQALTFVDKDEAKYLRGVERHTKTTLPRRTFEGFEADFEVFDRAPSQGGSGKSRRNRSSKSHGGSRNGYRGKSRRAKRG